MTVRLRFRMNEWTFSATKKAGAKKKRIEFGENVESIQVCVFVKKKMKKVIKERHKGACRNKDGRMEGRRGKVDRFFGGV